MTDIELRMKAARLMGWSIPGIWMEYNLPYSVPPIGWMPSDDASSIGISRDGEAEYILPDYTGRMADAWTLVVRLEDLGYETILVNCAHGNLKAVRVVEGVAAPFAPKDMLDHPVYFSEAIANVQDESMARAITRAFIEVMEDHD